MERKIDQLRTQLMNPIEPHEPGTDEAKKMVSGARLYSGNITGPIRWNISPYFAPWGDRPMPCCDALTAGSYWMLLVPSGELT